MTYKLFHIPESTFIDIYLEITTKTKWKLWLRNHKVVKNIPSNKYAWISNNLVEYYKKNYPDTIIIFNNREFDIVEVKDGDETIQTNTSWDG